MIKDILIVIYKFIRGIFRFIYIMSIAFICLIIKKAFNEKGCEKHITVRKAKRIRFLTNLKLKFFELCPHLASFLGEKQYLENLKDRLNYGL